VSRALRSSGALALLLACSAPPVSVAPVRQLDDFESPGAWAAEASDGVLAQLGAVPGAAGDALELRFDFQGHGGHAGIRRPLSLDLPENYEISFSMRGEAAPNDLQFKLLDPSGENVWWFRQRDVVPSKGWKRVTFKKRQLEFAWGTARDHVLRHAAALELVVAAGSGGGHGSLAFDELEIRELPLPPAVPPQPTVRASSNAPAAARLLDGRADPPWESAPGAGPSQQIDVDFGYAREFGGLILRWAPGAEASSYDVELSDDGARWRLARRVTEGNGGRDALLLPESEARFLRLRMHAGPASHYGLNELEIEDLAFGATPNAFIGALAREAPRGRYPRSYVGEQPYWTLVGVDAGSDSGLISEDGAIEVGRGGFSIEPFILAEGKLFSWADVEIHQSLLDGYLPIPSVAWQRPEWSLQVTAFASGDEGRADLAARYDVTNLTSEPLSLTLVLAARDLQVNPPTQSLNQAGGFSPIRQLAWSGDTLSINGKPAFRSFSAPGQINLSPFDAAEFPERMPTQPRNAPVDDPTAMAGALLQYPLTLPPGGTVTLGVAAPLFAQGKPGGPAIDSLDALKRAQEGVAASWHGKLDRVGIEVPRAAQPLVDTLRSSLAHILMSRDGAMLRPGTRSYARSWIRDGAMMSESLLRLGHEAAAGRYYDWYVPFQFAGGKVPCCVDARGADPVPEHDSAGELIFLAAELHRFTGDRDRLERSFSHVEAAASYLESLRQQTRGAEFLRPERRELYGLLPPSISHEGYSDKPAYSYWDDFWGLIGYQDAAFLAEAAGRPDVSARIASQRDEFQRDLYASLRASATRHDVSFLPGAADRGDFDATSTTIALAPGREASKLPRDLLLGTFERYWEEFSARRSGGKPYDAYTPYELRVAGSFIRLGWRERAQVLLDFFMADRRPSAWNQWAEVVGRDERQPRFVGDMPHAWISSDYIRSVLDLFAYTRESDQALVLAAGVPSSWLDETGVRVRGLRTIYGPLDFSLVRAHGQLILTLAGQAPPGGFVLPWLWPGTPAESAVTIDGQPARWEAGEITIRHPRSRVVIDLPKPQ
jgi:F5/8 type C domain-containing protein